MIFSPIPAGLIIPWQQAVGVCNLKYEIKKAVGFSTHGLLGYHFFYNANGDLKTMG
jgi:hypothetical protein